MSTLGPALGLLELESLARGVVVADALVKKASIDIAIAEAVTPGKYLLIFFGAVAELEESFREGLAVGGALVLDQLMLPHVAEAVRDALLHGTLQPSIPGGAVGIVEAHTVAATLKAADACLKVAEVRLTSLQLAKGIGGKGWFMLSGAQHDVEAALERAASVITAPLLVATELIARPHAELRGRVL